MVYLSVVICNVFMSILKCFGISSLQDFNFIVGLTNTVSASHELVMYIYFSDKLQWKRYNQSYRVFLNECCN